MIRLMTLLRLTLLGTVVFGTKAAAQPWMENVPPIEKENFYSVQNAFNEYWKDRDIKEKGKGWKPFKRWEWFWEPRVFPSGTMPDRMQLYTEYQKGLERRNQQNPSGSSLANWTEMGPSSAPGGYYGIGRLNCVRTDPDDVNTIWVGAAAGGLWKSTDAGVTWSSNTDELPSLGVTDIAIDPSNNDIMYIATGDGDASDDYSVGVLKSTDAGLTWATTGLNWTTSQASLLSRLLIRPDDPNTLIAAGNGIYKTTDAGATWVQTSFTRIHDMEFKPGGPGTIYASGASSNVFRSTDGGTTWTSITSGFATNGTRVALGVTPANASYIYALVSNSSYGFLGMYRSTNGGDSWTLRSNSPNLLGWAVDGSDVGGQGWYDLAVAVSPTNAEEVYTGGVNIWKSTNGGSSWTISSMWYYIPGIAEVHADQHDLYFHPQSNVLFSGNDGGIYRTVDNGVNWSWIGNGLRVTQFYRFGSSQTDADRVIAGAQDNGTKMLNDDFWSDELGGDGMEALIDYSNASFMYGEIYFGAIHRSTNGGVSWAPIYGGIPESGGWITPYVIHPTDPMTLFAGFQHVWKTTNRGSNWTSISNFAGGNLEILMVAPSDPNVLYAGTGGVIYRTTDGGATDWTVISRPPGSGFTTSLAIHNLDPNHIWMTSSGYVAGQKVYESTDGGTTWTNVSGSLPNVPANCITYQNNSPNRVYVGTDIGVYYKDLTTPDWQDFNTGLANVTVTELEFQYATNKVRASTYGRGVWESDAVVTTGAVIGLSQFSVDFGRTEVGQPGEPVEIVMTNFGSVDTLTVTSIAVSGVDFQLTSVPPLPLNLGPQEMAILDVVFAPGAAGDFADSVAIESNATNGATILIQLSGRGVVIGQAQAGVMYAGGSGLHTVNIGTGEVLLIGESGLDEIQSLAIRPTTNELYGTSSSATTTTVYRISSISGDAIDAQIFSVPYMRGIAFSEGDTLYGAVSFGSDAGKLYRLDLATGNAMYIGTAASIIYSNLSFSPTSGALWASIRPVIGGKDKIYNVSTETGEATLVGQTGFPTRITAALAFDAAGRLYGITGSATQINEFIRIDTITAAGTLIGSMGTTELTALAMRTDSLVLGVTPGSSHQIPDAYMLEQNYPNPFNPATEIRYGLPQQSRVTLTVYNMLGQEILRLHEGTQSAGFHAAAWNGMNVASRPVASGIYFYKLDAAGEDGKNFASIKKMLLVK